MQDNSQRKSLSPCIIEWCIAMRRVKQGERQTSASQHRYAFSLCAVWKWKYFLLSWMYVVLIATREGFSLWFIAYIYPKTWIKYFLILMWKWYYMNCEGSNTSRGSLGILFFFFVCGQTIHERCNFWVTYLLQVKELHSMNTSITQILLGALIWNDFLPSLESFR